MGTERDDLETIIDGALAGYSAAEPLEGIERRVLNRLRADERARVRRSWAWGFALAFAASVVAAFVLLQPQPVPAPRAARIVLPNPVIEPAPARLQPPKRRAVGRRSLPKARQFPLPVPLNGEERALLALVERHPVEARQAFAELQKRGEEPLEITPIQIAPLPDNGGN